MKSSRTLLQNALRTISLFSFLAIFLIFTAAVQAAYNPATDNPYVKNGNSSTEKKWYEFYKKDPVHPYIKKSSGYWYSTKKENILVRGAKGAFYGVKRIADAAVTGK